MIRPQQIFLGTANPNKVRELNEMLGPLGIAVLPAWGKDIPSPEEDGSDYLANARIKAAHALKHSSGVVIADDSGLSVDALDGAPGLYSHRFGGEDLDFPGKIRRMLELMDSLPREKRTARFHCAIVVTDGQEEATFHEICEGWIDFAPRGTSGFGFDPVFVPVQHERTFAELTPDEKNAISHRGKAVQKLVKWLEELNG